jgi:hypothetical protein
MISVLERAKTFRALNRVATAIGNSHASSSNFLLTSSVEKLHYFDEAPSASSVTWA